MRFLRAILSGLFAIAAILAGLLAAIVVAITGAAVVLASRLRARPQRRPSPQAHPRPPVARSGDVIDVTATEVTVDPPVR